MSGSFDLNDDKSEKIILGLPLALRLSSRIGDTITVTSAYNIERTITTLSIPKTRSFVVSGIFESNNKDYDGSSVFTSLSSSQKLFGLRNQITGYEIRLNDFHNAEKIKNELEKEIDTKLFSINTWYDLHKEL
ncbi:MAG: hypothetical protein AABZ54_07915, partial [Bacteroidota bacterium]